MIRSPRAFAEADHGDALNRMFAVDAETQLPDDLLLLTDKMSMAVSLECRVPLLDHELVEMAASMPAAIKVRGGRLKHLMKEALSELLPREILDRQKRGFGTPMGAWLKTDLAPVLDRLLSPEVVRGRGLFRDEVVTRLVRRPPCQSIRRHRHPAGADEPRDLEPHLPRRPRRCRGGRRTEGPDRMKILYLCHRFPYPPKRGGKIRPFNMIRHLSAQRPRGHGVLAVAFGRRGRRRPRVSRRTAMPFTSAR